MSWICENCSTSNPNKNKQCFVCKAKRSRESVRKARRLEIEAFLERIKLPLCDGLTKGGMIVFFASIIVFSIVALISLYYTMQSGLINDIVLRMIAIVKNVFKNLVSLSRVNCVELLNKIIDSPVVGIPDNIKVSCVHAVSNVYGGVKAFFDSFISLIFPKINRSVSLSLGVMDLFIESVPQIRDVVIFIVEESMDRVRSIVSNVLYVIEKVKEQFLQFTSI